MAKKARKSGSLVQAGTAKTTAGTTLQPYSFKGSSRFWFFYSLTPFPSENEKRKSIDRRIES
jgi:hypothetical protein